MGGELEDGVDREGILDKGDSLRKRLRGEKQLIELCIAKIQVQRCRRSFIVMVMAQRGGWGPKPFQGLGLDSVGSEDPWWVLNRQRLVSLGFK